VLVSKGPHTLRMTDAHGWEAYSRIGDKVKTLPPVRGCGGRANRRAGFPPFPRARKTHHIWGCCSAGVPCKRRESLRFCCAQVRKAAGSTLPPPIRLSHRVRVISLAANWYLVDSRTGRVKIVCSSTASAQEN